MTHTRHIEPRTIHTTEDVIRAAQWLADRRSGGVKPVLPILKSRFGLTDADAAEAILLAGTYSICRRAFG